MVICYNCERDFDVVFDFYRIFQCDGCKQSLCGKNASTRENRRAINKIRAEYYEEDARDAENWNRFLMGLPQLGG